MTQNATGILELHINFTSVRLYPTPYVIDNDDLAIASLARTAKEPSHKPSLCLLRGPLDDFLKYSRQEASKWLIDIAHDICDPADHHGSLLVWKEPQQQWCHVSPTDPLTSSIYRYDLADGITVGVSKISQRRESSETSAAGDAGAIMTASVKSRDERCWATRARLRSVRSSQIVPKRMGDLVARIILRTFTSLTPPPTLSIYNEIFGLCLSAPLHTCFEQYELGLRYVSPNGYECHSFVNEEEDGYLTATGIMDSLEGHTAVHGLVVRPPHPERDNIPPAGLFRWHYLQCVINKFAHDDYRNLQNIDYDELPLSIRRDSDFDDEGTYSESDWPSKVFDLGRIGEHDEKGNEEHHHAMAAWISTVCI